MDLTPYMNQYGSNLNKATLNNATYNGKVNGLTFTSNLAVLYCNTELFERYNVKLPETYEDLVSAVKVFRENGITPLSVGEQAMWPGMFHYATMAIREGGVDLTLKALEGKESFNQKPFIEAANKLLNLVKLGAFNDGAAGIDVDQAMAVAQNGQAAMIYQGNWAASGFDSSDVKGKIVPLKWPTVKDGKGNNDALGGAVDMISAAASSDNSDITARAAFGIAENFSLTGYELGSFITTWDSSDVDSSQLPSLFKQITELNQTYDNYQMWWDTFLGGEKAQSVLNLIARLFIDDITAEEFVVEMDAAVR